MLWWSIDHSTWSSCAQKRKKQIKWKINNIFYSFGWYIDRRKVQRITTKTLTTINKVFLSNCRRWIMPHETAARNSRPHPICKHNYVRVCVSRRKLIYSNGLLGNSAIETDQNASETIEKKKTIATRNTRLQNIVCTKCRETSETRKWATNESIHCHTANEWSGEHRVNGFNHMSDRRLPIPIKPSIFAIAIHSRRCYKMCRLMLLCLARFFITALKILRRIVTINRIYVLNYSIT